MKLRFTAKPFDVYGSLSYAVAPGTCSNCCCHCCCNFSLYAQEVAL